MEMHPYYTEIPLRSFEEMAFEGYLSEVLLALIVDPLEAEDVSRAIREVYPTRIELTINGKVADAPIALADFLNLPSKHAFEQLKITLSQWAMTTEDASEAIGKIANWDCRLGAWCACAVSRVGIQFIPYSEAATAIAAAEECVKTKKMSGLVVEYAERFVKFASYINSNTLPNSTPEYWSAVSVASALHAAVSARDVAICIERHEAAVSNGEHEAADDYAAHIRYATDSAASEAVSTVANLSAAFVWKYREYDAESVRVSALTQLREVVANACLTFPG